MDYKYIFLLIAISWGINVVFRLSPFVIFGGKKTQPKFLNYLSKVLPYALIAMLVIYCLKDINFSSINGYLPMFIGCVVAVLTYIITKKSIVAIAVSTVSYVILVSFVFV